MEILETTTDGNKLIAEFMGYKEPEGKFHSSWDWLMPVVEKIRNTKDDSIFKERVFTRLVKCNIRDTYSAVVDFIIWHNANKG